MTAKSPYFPNIFLEESVLFLSTNNWNTMSVSQKTLDKTIIPKIWKIFVWLVVEKKNKKTQSDNENIFSERNIREEVTIFVSLPYKSRVGVRRRAAQCSRPSLTGTMKITASQTIVLFSCPEDIWYLFYKITTTSVIFQY